jgi:aspartyl-tRNA synthetase
MMGDWIRTIYCGLVDDNLIDNEVVIMGWVSRRRDHGGIIFLDLRDREGLLQIVINPDNKEIFSLAQSIRNEYVVAVKGIVQKRPQGTENPKIRSGFVEVKANRLKILNDSKTLPFQLDEYLDVGEEIRLKYRYLDLRRAKLQQNLLLRDKMIYSMREFLHSNGFIDLETPFLAKSTPEGARDYLVPSRVNPGKFYALPQSPQIFKQLLMVAGFDRYYQIVRCFRDEDLRSDRQPEFTQLDIEMSFIDRDDLLSLLEAMFKKVLKDVLGIEIKIPIDRLTYDEAIDKYGTDAPDVRFGMHLKSIENLLFDCNYSIFLEALRQNGVIRGLKLEGASHFSRKDLDEINRFVISMGAKGLSYIRISENSNVSSLSKYLGNDKINEIVKYFDGKLGDIIFIMAGDRNIVNLALAKTRVMLAKKMNLIKDNSYAFVWLVDFPLFEWNKDENKYDAMHHPFTSPRDEDVSFFDEDPLKIKAKAYDLVLNGQEIGGGSIRIHRSDIQSKMFKTLGLTEDQIEKKFGFFVEALRYGTPPHGGIAFGIDRIISIFTNSDSIRDVIAFPKTQKAVCLMTDTPSTVDEKQLNELFIKIDL